MAHPQKSTPPIFYNPVDSSTSNWKLHHPACRSKRGHLRSEGSDCKSASLGLERENCSDPENKMVQKQPGMSPREHTAPPGRTVRERRCSVCQVCHGLRTSIQEGE